MDVLAAMCYTSSLTDSQGQPGGNTVLPLLGCSELVHTSVWNGERSVRNLGQCSVFPETFDADFSLLLAALKILNHSIPQTQFKYEYPKTKDRFQVTAILDDPHHFSQ